jgi:MFS family permease
LIPDASPSTGKESESSPKTGSIYNLKAFSSLKYIDCRWLMLANLASFMAIGMQQLTRGWLVLRLTNDSPLALSLVTMSFALPMTFMSLVGGVLADRLPKRKLMITSQTTVFLTVLLLATLDYAGIIQFWHLIVIGIINGSVVSLNMPSRQSIFSDIVPDDELMGAIALNNSATNSTRLVGPSLAGFLIIFIGTAGVFYLIAGIHLVSLIFICLLKTGINPKGKNQKSVTKDMAEGFRYAKSNPIILGLVILSLVPSIFGFPYVALLPAWARESLNAHSLGLGALEACMGFGSLLGTLILASFNNLKNRGRFLIINGLVWGIVLVLFAGCSAYYSALPGIFIVGFMSSIFMALNNTLMQVKSSEEMRGRMVSLSTMTFGIMPLSAVPFGVVAEHIGTPYSLMIAGAILCTFMIIFYFSSRDFRRIAQ